MNKGKQQSDSAGEDDDESEDEDGDGEDETLDSEVRKVKQQNETKDRKIG